MIYTLVIYSNKWTIHLLNYNTNVHSSGHNLNLKIIPIVKKHHEAFL